MSIALGGVTLPEDLVWTDELNYSSVAQNKQRTLTGALIVQESAKIKGRPITLTGTAESGWIDRATLLTLQTLVDTVDNDLVLNFNGTNYNVRFDRDNGLSPITTAQIIDCSDPTAIDPYSIVIKLMTV